MPIPTVKPLQFYPVYGVCLFFKSSLLSFLWKTPNILWAVQLLCPCCPFQMYFFFKLCVMVAHFHSSSYLYTSALFFLFLSSEIQQFRLFSNIYQTCTFTTLKLNISGQCSVSLYTMDRCLFLRMDSDKTVELRISHTHLQALTPMEMLGKKDFKEW